MSKKQGRTTVGVLAALVAAGTLGLPVLANAKTARLKATVSPASVSAGGSVALTVRGAAKRQTCKLTVRSGRKTVVKRHFKAPKGTGLSTAVTTRPGKRTVVVRCGKRIARAIFTVTPASKAAPTPPTAPAPQADEQYEQGFGVTPEELALYPLPPGIGGDGFSTRIPLPRGFSVLVTQGQNGPYSHGRASTRYAIDLGAGQGTPVHAGFSGTVVRAVTGCPVGNNQCGGGWGNNVLLRAADGTCAIHAHLSSVNVAPGQGVARYAVLGAVGSTGWSTGAHLHYSRMDCVSGASMPWGFDEAGTPGEGARITSLNEPPPAAAPATPPSTPAPAKTYTETSGPATNKTFTNHMNAGGTLGPTIAPYSQVQITCKTQGFVVSNGNPWWYKLASAPWNNQYWATADAFYNNGATSGSLAGTPYVDPAVPNC